LDSENCFNAVKAGISLFGVPSRIIVDQGLVVDCVTSVHQIKFNTFNCNRGKQGKRPSGARDKHVESTVETSDRSWQDALMDIQLAMNCTSNRVTNFIPLELLLGKQARPLGMLPIIAEPKVDCKEARAEAKENLDKNENYEKSRIFHNKAKIVKHGIGDHVLLRSEERH